MYRGIKEEKNIKTMQLMNENGMERKFCLSSSGVEWARKRKLRREKRGKKSIGYNTEGGERRE